MNRYRLLKGDCLKRMKEIEDHSIDMVMADPPYGTTACKWDAIIPLGPMWKQLKRLIKPNGAIVIMASQPFTTTLIVSNIKMFRYEWIWQKNHGSFATAKIQPLKRHENVLVFSFGSIIYNRQMVKIIGKVRDRRTENYRIKENNNNFTSETIQINSKMYAKDYDPKKKNPISLLKIKSVYKPVHPTQKPVALMEYLIRTYTNENELVLDFAMGSGTTGVACMNLNRKFIGIELDTKYFKIAKKRIRTAKNKGRLF